MARRREVELDDLRVAGHWAALHSTDPKGDPGFVRGCPGGDRLVAVGGEGTPRVRELCFHELGIARQVHAQSARAVVADVLDLQHRLPLTWARLEALAADAFVARRVAVKSRELPLAVVGLVDVAVAAVIGRLSAGRVLAIAEPRSSRPIRPAMPRSSRRNAAAGTWACPGPTSTGCAP